MYHLMRRYHPHGPMREFKRLLDSPFLSELSDFWEKPFPATDVKDLKDSVEVTMDLPGIEKDQISIEYNNSVLTVSGKAESVNEVEEDDFFRQERYYGSFQRQIALPSQVDYSKAKASFNNGVLRIMLPKTGEAKGNTIEIE